MILGLVFYCYRLTLLSYLKLIQSYSLWLRRCRDLASSSSGSGLSCLCQSLFKIALTSSSDYAKDWGFSSWCRLRGLGYLFELPGTSNLSSISRLIHVLLGFGAPPILYAGAEWRCILYFIYLLLKSLNQLNLVIQRHLLDS